MSLDIEELKRLAREAMNAKWQPLRYMEYLDIQRKYELAASPSVVDELIQRLERAEQDAKRYRWLRDGNNDAEGLCPLVCDEDLDRAIDEAMK